MESAASKVSTTVSYENSGQVLVLNVTTNFAPGDQITVAGLQFTNFTAVSAASNLQLVTAGSAGGGRRAEMAISRFLILRPVTHRLRVAGADAWWTRRQPMEADRTKGVVAFIGLGQMGRQMAQRLGSAGFTLPKGSLNNPGLLPFVLFVLFVVAPVYCFAGEAHAHPVDK